MFCLDSVRVCCCTLILLHDQFDQAYVAIRFAGNFFRARVTDFLEFS